VYLNCICIFNINIINKGQLSKINVNIFIVFLFFFSFGFSSLTKTVHKNIPYLGCGTYEGELIIDLSFYIYFFFVDNYIFFYIQHLEMEKEHAYLMMAAYIQAKLKKINSMVKES
jgi:hypothetical protein